MDKPAPVLAKLYFHPRLRIVDLSEGSGILYSYRFLTPSTKPVWRFRSVQSGPVETKPLILEGQNELLNKL